jgi:hypothetical protein
MFLPDFTRFSPPASSTAKQRDTGDPTTDGKSTAAIPGATERVNLSWDAAWVKGLNFNCNLMETGSAAFDARGPFQVKQGRARSGSESITSAWRTPSCLTQDRDVGISIGP